MCCNGAGAAFRRLGTGETFLQKFPLTGLVGVFRQESLNGATLVSVLGGRHLVDPLVPDQRHAGAIQLPQAILGNLVPIALLHAEAAAKMPMAAPN